MSNYDNKVQTAMVESAAKAMDVLGIMEANEAKKMLHGAGPGKARFPSYAILTAENPDCMQLPAAENNKRMEELTSTLASGKYPFRRVKGFYGVTDGAHPEHSVVIGGITLDTAKNMSKFWGQQSFIFITRDEGNKVSYQMWAKGPAGEYEQVDEKDRINFVPSDQDFYSRAGDFKGSIPFEHFTPGSSPMAGDVEHDGSALGQAYGTAMNMDTDVNDAINYLDSFLEGVTGTGTYGKLFEGLNGGPKIARYYWQCRCEGMAGAKYGDLGIICEAAEQEKHLFPMIEYGYSTNRHPVQPLTEATVDRLLQHGKDGMVILSADREERTPEENYAKRHELLGDIKNRNLSYIVVYGGYRDINTTPPKTANGETSFVLPAHDRNGNPVPWEELESFAKEMCGKYDQESVLVQPPGQNPRWIDRDGNAVVEFDGPTVKNDLKQQYFSSLIKSKHYDEKDPGRLKRFSFTSTKMESCDGLFVNPPPCTGGEKHRRILDGEIFALWDEIPKDMRK